MIRKNPSGHLPVIDESAYIDKTAIICGKVIIKENVFVGPYAVIRADEVDASGDMDPITIGANSNIQDGVVIHSKSGAAVTSVRPRAEAHQLERARQEHFRYSRRGDAQGRIRTPAGPRALRQRDRHWRD